MATQRQSSKKFSYTYALSESQEGERVVRFEGQVRGEEYSLKSFFEYISNYAADYDVVLLELKADEM